ncbi:MAG: hypothetical protein JKY56_05535 [Kofleriaceae bacterium]|nr:hypothetical protein [Kofleriaceae bacterium]
MRTQTILILAPILLAFSACGGMSKAQSNMAGASYKTNAPAAEAADLYSPEGKRAEISRRFQEISQWRRQAGQRPEPDQSEVDTAPESVAVARTAESGSAATRSLSCQDICRIQDAICDNAESICQLADELGDDEWAQDKCESSKASCEDAGDKCTDCTPSSSKKDSDTKAKIPPTL